MLPSLDVINYVSQAIQSEEFSYVRPERFNTTNNPDWTNAINAALATGIPVWIGSFVS